MPLFTPHARSSAHSHNISKWYPLSKASQAEMVHALQCMKKRILDFFFFFFFAGGQMVFIGVLPFSPHLTTVSAQKEWNQDQDSLLVKRRNDNHSPGPVIRELVPSSHQRSELCNTVLCIFSGWDQRIGEGIPIPGSMGEETTLINMNAFSKSNMNVSTCPLLSKILAQSFITVVNWVSQLCPFLNACCLSDRSLYSSRWAMIFEHTMCSSNLQGSQVKETGR